MIHRLRYFLAFRRWVALMFVYDAQLRHDAKENRG
jgi:hypothetical protein